MLAKKCDAIAFANLTTALDSPSLMGMLMQAQMPSWPQGLTSVVVNQLFEKYEPHNTVSMINVNRLKQKIGLPTPDSNPQVMFEQIASLENLFKMPVLDSEKIAIAIKKLPPEYQAMLTSEMSKEALQNIMKMLYFSAGELYMDHMQRMPSLMAKQKRKQMTKK